MATNSALLGLWAETSLHAGAGSSVDGIDLPIQREGHSGFPCVFGSAVKGAMRAKAEETWLVEKDGKNVISEHVSYVFGPDSDSEKASEHAGALMVSDARLLLLPVRSLTGYFKWVTCPALLERLLRDAARLGIELEDFVMPEPDTDNAVLPANGGNDLFLEEYRFTTTDEDLNALCKVLAAISGIDKDSLEKQLAVVSNDKFSYLCRYATPVAAHIAIDNKTKVVKNGALWYEETLPPETVFYVGLAANAVRKKETNFEDSSYIKDSKAQAVLGSITGNLFKQPAYLQLGGNETVGMGWCKVSVFNGGA